jgi:hypothetical protein
MRLPGRRLAAVCGLILALSGCNHTDVGYVEIKTTSSMVAAPALYLDADKLAPFRDGASVLRQRVGERKLQADLESGKVALCTIVVKKNRLTSVTISLLDRPPRCNCVRAGAPTDKPSEKTCIS